MTEEIAVFILGFPLLICGEEGEKEGEEEEEVEKEGIEGRGKSRMGKREGERLKRRVKKWGRKGVRSEEEWNGEEEQEGWMRDGK